VVIQLIAVGIFIGVYKTTIAFMQQQQEEIKRQIKEDKAELKADMKKYNNVLERIAVAENSISAAHHRIDSIEDKF
jgi:septal ring factor EnvC (AmiA/AmiB activator)